MQDVVNLQPNVTKSSGSCDSDSASLRLTTDAEKTNLTLFFTLVSYCISQPYKTPLCHLSFAFIFTFFLPETATRWQQELEVNLFYDAVLLTCVALAVFLQNTTSNKYHLSEVSLSAAWPDMKGECTLPPSIHAGSLISD